MLGAKLYLLAFLVMTISIYCDCAHDDNYLPNILHKLDEVKQTLLFEIEVKISTLENKVDKILTLENKVGETISTLKSKVDKLLGEEQTCRRYNDTQDCPALLVENAMVYPRTGIITQGSSATVTCVPGFTIMGKSTVTCLEGKYDSIPSCKADCQALSVPYAIARPSTRVAHGTIVQVVCSGENALDGEYMVMCYDGSYENIPSCVFDLSSVKAVYIKKIRINVKGEWSSVNAAEFLPDGRLLVVDNASKKVRLLSSSFSYEGSVEIDLPYDIAVVNETTAIVTDYSSTKPQLHFINVTPSLQLQSAIPLEQRCFGIDVYNDTIYITCHKYNEHQGHIKLLDMDGKLTGTLGVTVAHGHNYYKFRRPVFVRISRFTGNVYVSDWAAHTVTCFSQTGEVIFEFRKTRALEYPEGFILDDRDNILIIGDGVDMLEILDNGQNYKILPKNGNGLQYIEALAYRPTDGVLLVGEYGSESMNLYQLYPIN